MATRPPPFRRGTIAGNAARPLHPPPPLNARATQEEEEEEEEEPILELRRSTSMLPQNQEQWDRNEKAIKRARRMKESALKYSGLTAEEIWARSTLR